MERVQGEVKWRSGAQHTCYQTPAGGPLAAMTTLETGLDNRDWNTTLRSLVAPTRGAGGYVERMKT